MKQAKTYIAVLFIMTCALMSCSQEEEVTGTPIPMTLTATVGQTTRTTADNSTWAGTEQIAIMTTQAGETTTSVKKYSVNTNGDMTVASDENEPFYFRTTYETKSVSAWYPYSTAMPTEWTVQTDQSGNGYANSDLLIAPATEVTYNGSLKFEHQTAKFTVNVTQLGKDAPELSTISIAGITPHKGATSGGATTYNALVSPQELNSGASLFTIVTTEGNVYIYSLPNALTLTAGTEYIYNITVTLLGLTVTSSNSISWTNGSTGSGTVTME